MALDSEIVGAVKTPFCLRVFVVASVPVILTMALYAASARADDSARISRLESEIQLLRTRLDEQQRQILRLQEELNRRKIDPVVGTILGKREDRAVASTTDRQPWHSPETWVRISKGMSEEEVTVILGPPTAIESFGPYTTLFYRGPVAGGSLVSGHINMMENRVLAVSTPVFGDR